MKNILFLFSALFFVGCANDWRTASKDSAGIAPHPDELNEAIVQVYAARAVSWRGWFAVHPWISWKSKDDDQYTVTQVVGWRTRRGLSSVVTQHDLPDRYWFGSQPTLISEVRGEKAERAIARLKELIPAYPYANEYRVWPGPNSNTYIAHLIRNTPELVEELPPHAIGKDWLVDYTLVAPSASGTGFQFSLFGALGLTMGVQEGIEVNILGLNFGVDFWKPALKLPLIGRLGFPSVSTEAEAKQK